MEATAHLVTGTVRTYGAMSDTIFHSARVSWQNRTYEQNLPSSVQKL